MSEKKTPGVQFEELNQTRQQQYRVALGSLTRLVLSHLPPKRKRELLAEIATGKAMFMILALMGCDGESVALGVRRGKDVEILERLYSPADDSNPLSN
jgi:hypothetical protein